MVKTSKEVAEGKIYAFLGVFLTIIGFIIVLFAKKENRYAVYYAKQGLVLFIASIIVWMINAVLAFLPFIGWFLAKILQLGLFALWVMGMVYALSGEEKEIPLIGKFGEKLNI